MKREENNEKQGKEKEDVQEKAGTKTSRTNFSLAWVVNRCRIKRTSRQPWIKTMAEEMEETDEKEK